MKTDATIQIKLTKSKKVPFKEIYSADRKHPDEDADLWSWAIYKSGDGTILVISANAEDERERGQALNAVRSFANDLKGDSVISAEGIPYDDAWIHTVVDLKGKLRRYVIQDQGYLYAVLEKSQVENYLAIIMSYEEEQRRQSPLNKAELQQENEEKGAIFSATEFEEETESIKWAEKVEFMKNNPKEQEKIRELRDFCENFPIEKYIKKENDD